MSLKFSLENSLKKLTAYSLVALLNVAHSFSSIQNFFPEKKLSITNYEDSPRIRRSLITEGEHYRQEYLKYIDHSSYKERLKREMFVEEELTNDQQLVLDKEFEERKRRIGEVNIDIIKRVVFHSGESYTPASFYEPPEDLNLEKGHKVVSLQEHIFHEFSHAAELAGFTDINRFEAGFEHVLSKYLTYSHHDLNVLKSSKEYADYLVYEKELRVKLVDFLEENSERELYFGGLSHKDLTAFIEVHVLHEPADGFLRRDLLTRDSGDPFEFMGGFTPEVRVELEERYVDLFEKIKPVRDELERISHNADYYEQSTEIKARLNDLRIKAIKNFDYDINGVFDINNFLELKNDEQYQDLRNKLRISDEGINELMKCTALLIDSSSVFNSYLV